MTHSPSDSVGRVTAGVRVARQRAVGGDDVMGTPEVIASTPPQEVAPW